MSVEPSDSSAGPREAGARNGTDRRSLIANAGMFGGLAAAYGALGAMAVRFLYPAEPRRFTWQYVADVASMKPGDSLVYVAPSGESVSIARQAETGKVDDFIALSSTCPHLGCHVHYEPANSRFFCPCHNGVFNLSGKAIAGPPGEAGQSLPRFELKIEGQILMIAVPSESLTGGRTARVEPPPPRRGAGHDPCLAPPRSERSA